MKISDSFAEIAITCNSVTLPVTGFGLIVRAFSTGFYRGLTKSENFLKIIYQEK